MRPLIRGAQGTYPYTIDMSSYANLITSLRHYSLNYNAPAVRRTIGSSPTLDRQLGDVWLTVSQVAAGQIPSPADIAALRAAQTKIAKRIGKQYRLAANQLIVNMGRFCAYCEKPNPSPLPVEHMVPKDNYPLFSLAWSNFLNTCTVCNTQGTGKGTGPARATVAGWNPAPIADELTYFTRCRAQYLWPDEQLAYRSLVPRLEYFSASQVAWLPVPVADSVGPGIRRTSWDYPTRTINAAIYLDHTSDLFYRRVRVSYAALPGRAAESQTYLGLDQQGGGNDPNNPTTSDGREFDRTTAWFALVGLLGRARFIPDREFEDWWNNTVLPLADIVGNFSLWVRILDLLNITDVFGRSLLSRFLNDCRAANSPFPGTDTAQVP